MLAAGQNRFAEKLQIPSEIEWLTSNVSGYTVDDTRRIATDIGLKPLTMLACGP
ncbi:transposase [Burkholderia lata]|nr:transposase [Burkholderia lata]